jgi:hypothetical protein
MPTNTAALVGPVAPSVINGVDLLTRAGVPKSRYTFAEKLRLLGCSEEQLQAFADLFAPRKFDYAVTRARSGNPRDWSGGRGPLTLDRVARHLLGARLPGVNPQWVAPRGWDWTLFVAVDVDNRGGTEEFLFRCRKLEAALAALEVPPEARLVVPTPSGGLHYYFFTSARIRTAEIAPTLALAGILARKGKFEIFPSPTQGLRLPFGHIQGHPHAPEEWLSFLARYRSGALPTVNWEECKHLAKVQAAGPRGNQRHLFPEEPDEVEPQKRTPAPDGAPPRATRAEPKRAGPGMPKRERQRDLRYEELVTTPVRSPADMEELWALGIREAGTRHEAVLRLAWNFIFVRGCEEDEAVEEISAWAYRTGEFSSKDVRADLEGGGNRVEEDVRDLVRRFARLRDEGGHRTGGRFAEAEVNAIHRATAGLTPRLSRFRGRFLLEFLRFAKSHGRTVEGGWECAPAVRGIIQEWPGCSGMRYKAHLDWARDAGILVLTREKRQTVDRTGRARTYLLRMPQVVSGECVLTLDEAIARLPDGPGRAVTIPEVTIREGVESDTYQVGLPPKEEDGLDEVTASDPTNEPVAEGNKGNNESGETNVPPGPGPQAMANEPEQMRSDHADRPEEPAHAAGDGGNEGPAPTRREPTSIDGGTRNPECEHPRRALRRLAEGTPECPGLQPPVQGICDPRPGRIRAVLPRRRRPGVTPGERRPLSTAVPLPSHDPAAVTATIRAVKVALAIAFPGRDEDIEAHPCWPLIEAMALDPTYTERQRSVLLANPLHLPPSDLAFRKELIREYRARPPFTCTSNRSPPTGVGLHGHGLTLVPTESLELSG